MERPVRDHDDADSYSEVLTTVPRRPRVLPGQASYRSAPRLSKVVESQTYYILLAGAYGCSTTLFLNLI